MYANGRPKALVHLAFLSATITLLLVTPPSATAGTNKHPLCQALANGTAFASSGAQMWCFGPQPNGPMGNIKRAPTKNTGTGFLSNNVNAASFSEDITSNGERGSGQSETSIAASGQYVLEGWNDSTGFFAPCPSPGNKEELSGFGFSSNAGKTFSDLGAPPNANCNTWKYEGDPSIDAYVVAGNTYFYYASLFPSLTGTDYNAVALAACQVQPGSPATLSCGQPIVAAASSECQSGFCSFLDKDFVTIDAAHGRLYVAYTEFGITFGSQIEVASCDLGNAFGGRGPLGGTPAVPVCENGSAASSATPPPPYLIVEPADLINFCELEGAYPAVSKGGDLYVANELNWGDGCSQPHLEQVAFTPQACLTLPASSCGPAASTEIPVISTDLTEIPGYNRGVGNDFPRIAVSDPKGTVSIVWNDTRTNPQADILLQSLWLVSLTGVQAAPVKLNNDNVLGTLHFLPALRNTDKNGLLSVSWYDRRRNPNSADTDVYAALAVDPTTTSTPSSNVRVTNVQSDWLSVGSIIIPNFGDYTDNFIDISGSMQGMFVAWSDGRYNIPQPFAAHQGVKEPLSGTETIFGQVTSRHPELPVRFLSYST